MTQAYHQLLEAVRALPSRERLAMIQTLLEDFKQDEPSGEMLEGQLSELNRRMDAFYAGKMEVVSGEEARERLRKKADR